MDRLTYRGHDGQAYEASNSGGRKELGGNFGDKFSDRINSLIKDKNKLIDRLCAYEDTGLMPDEIPNLKAQLNAAIADLKSCKLDRVRTCANYQKCFDKAKEEFRMMPCMSKSCPGWEWRGSQLPKATT